MTPLLTVISGGPDTGKSLIAELLVKEKGCAMVARDLVRPTFGVAVDEGIITQTLAAMARTLLQAGHDVCTVSWNLLPSDRALWLRIAAETGAACRWVHIEAIQGKRG
jgi:predicted kinase